MKSKFVLRLRWLVARIVALQSNDYPGIRRVRIAILRSLLNAPDLTVGSAVRFDRSHPELGGHLSLGTGVELGAGSCIDVSGGLVIASEATLSEGVRVFTHNHNVSARERHWRDQGLLNLPVSIEEGVWVGAGAIVLGQAKRIGRGAVVGAGAVVSKEVPPWAIVVGNPARVIGFRQ
jgi:acetyltransferase-like isoleucine patch superfamily enzyme